MQHAMVPQGTPWNEPTGDWRLWEEPAQGDWLFGRSKATGSWNEPQRMDPLK